MAAMLSIHRMANTWILYISFTLCSLVPGSLQTPQFSPNLFTRPSKNSTCSPNSLVEARLCTAKLNVMGMPGPMFDEIVPLEKALQDGCVHGKFFDAVDCIERITQDCRHDKSDIAHTLRQMVDVDGTRKAIVHFCANIKTYVANTECVKQSLPAMKSCGSEAQALLRTQIKATSNVDSQMIFQCAFFSVAAHCAKNTLRERCNKAISSLVFTVMVEPPICANSIYSIASAGGTQQKHQNHPDGNHGAGSIFLESRRHLLVLNYCLSSCVMIFIFCKFNVRW